MKFMVVLMWSIAYILRLHFLCVFPSTDYLSFGRVDDIITQVNDVNVENVMHAAAVQALKDSGNSARLVSPTL